MMRRKGERPIPKLLDDWSEAHPVAHAIRTGTTWFSAWQGQRLTTLAKLARQTGMGVDRLMAIDNGDRVSRAEVDALARAWRISTNDLVASIPDPSIVVD